MKLFFAKKSADTIAAQTSSVSAKPAAVLDEKKPIILGLIFICVSFAGVVFLFYLNATAQKVKDVKLRELNQELSLVNTEKDFAAKKIQELESQAGSSLDLEKVVRVSKKVNEQSESNRKDGSLWINRKTGSAMVTLGVLNGVTKGSRLDVFDSDKKIATVKVTLALDIVSYVEPVDKIFTDFRRDYYQVKSP